jgi:hypothetical protein
MHYKSFSGIWIDATLRLLRATFLGHGTTFLPVTQLSCHRLGCSCKFSASTHPSCNRRIVPFCPDFYKISGIFFPTAHHDPPRPYFLCPYKHDKYPGLFLGYKLKFSQYTPVFCFDSCSLVFAGRLAFSRWFAGQDGVYRKVHWMKRRMYIGITAHCAANNRNKTFSKHVPRCSCTSTKILSIIHALQASHYLYDSAAI